MPQTASQYEEPTAPDHPRTEEANIRDPPGHHKKPTTGTPRARKGPQPVPAAGTAADKGQELLIQEEETSRPKLTRGDSEFQEAAGSSSGP